MATAQWDGLQAVFEDLGGYGALARQAAQGEGPLVGHLQRTNIQLAAIPVFTRKGVAETTVNDLLEAARVSRRTFYKYFAGKLEVLESIYHSAVQLLLARFGGLRSEAGSDEDWLRAMVSLFFDYHLAVGPIIRMMQEEALHAGSPLAAHRQRAHLKIIELWAERLGAQGGPRCADLPGADLGDGGGFAGAAQCQRPAGAAAGQAGARRPAGGYALSPHPGSDETARVTAGQSPLAPTEPRLGSQSVVAML